MGAPGEGPAPLCTRVTHNLGGGSIRRSRPPIVCPKWLDTIRSPTARPQHGWNVAHSGSGAGMVQARPRVVARYAMPLPVGLLCVSWRAWRSSTDHRLRLQSDGEQHQVTIMSLRVGPPAGRRTVLEEERDAAVRAYAGPRHPLQARRRAQTVGAGCRARRSERLRA